MNCFRKFGVFALAVVLLGYPAIACLAPNAELSTAERECCAHMPQQCGDMDMPASHSCCQHELQVSPAMLPAAHSHSAPVLASVVALQDSGTLVHASREAVPAFLSNSPPGSPPLLSSILRI
ncbi:MAG TPA: hypothetical protein VFQ00_10040 [Terriglobales bacterium]|nr:hypothetical protein [Terriglobales bacterium]